MWAAHEIALFAPWLAPAPCVPKGSKRQPIQMAALTVMRGHHDCSDRSGPWDLSLRSVCLRMRFTATINEIVDEEIMNYTFLNEYV